MHDAASSRDASGPKCIKNSGAAEDRFARAAQRSIGPAGASSRLPNSVCEGPIGTSTPAMRLDRTGHSLRRSISLLQNHSSCCSTALGGQTAENNRFGRTIGGFKPSMELLAANRNRAGRV